VLTCLFVLTRIIANPVSNVFQKKLTHHPADPLFIICVTHALLSLVALPCLLCLLPLPVTPAFWSNMIICALLAVAGNMFLVRALRSTDLSIIGPINAYKSIISLVLGIFLLQEIPTAMGLLGVVLILAGSFFVADQPVDQPRKNAFVQFFANRGVQWRFAALILSAVEAVFLKRALLASSPLTTFLMWCILGLPIAAAAVAVILKGRAKSECVTLARHKGTYAWLAATTGLMQLSTLLTFGKLQVGYSLALFQTSTILSVFLGYKFFQERNIVRRLSGSLIMVVGAGCIIVFGARH
jgi:drug/metabolite transporter (DMT)-like permease